MGFVWVLITTKYVSHDVMYVTERNKAYCIVLYCIVLYCIVLEGDAGEGLKKH